MAKRYTELWPQIADKDNVHKGLHLAVKNKRKVGSIARVLEDEDNKVNNITIALQSGSYMQGLHQIKLLFEPKLRIIYTSNFYMDRIVHHAIMNILEPIYDARMYHYSFSCRKGYGQHRASALCMIFAMRNDYCAQHDCSQFYVNIDHGIMKDLYRWKFKDKELLRVLDTRLDSISTRQNNIKLLNNIINSGIAIEQAQSQLKKLTYSNKLFNNAPAGEPIGDLISQWDGNLYMTDFDFFVYNELGCKDYFRFCDDFLMFGNDKGQLHEWSYRAEEWLLEHRKIVLSRAEVFPTSQGIDCCGYRHFHNGKLLVRKRTAKKAQKRMSSILPNIDSGAITIEKARSQIGSTWGILKHAQTYNLRKSMGFDEIKNEVVNRAKKTV